MKLKLTIEVDYELNGENPETVKDRLQQTAFDTAGNGGFSGNTEAEVNSYNYKVEEVEQLDEIEQRYLDSGFMKCPNCDSDTIETTENNGTDSNTHWTEITCSDCNSTWKDLYKLVNLVDFEKI